VHLGLGPETQVHEIEHDRSAGICRSVVAYCSLATSMFAASTGIAWTCSGRSGQCASRLSRT